MNEVAIFENSDFGSIRVADKNGEPWFVGKDVATALGYTSTNMTMVFQAVPEEWKGSNRIATLGGEQEMLTISEQGLYFFLGRSDKPAALPYQKWVAGEVIPSIRKTGAYSVKIEKQNGLSPVATDFKALCEAASFLFDKNQAALCANTAIKKVYGEDLLALMGVPMLESPQQVRFYTPTECCSLQ